MSDTFRRSLYSGAFLRIELGTASTKLENHATRQNALSMIETLNPKFVKKPCFHEQPQTVFVEINKMGHSEN